MGEIEIRNVSKVFDGGTKSVTALADVSLTIPHGEFVSIVGASGCGKSTLMNLVAGFESPTRGSVKVGGQDVTRPGPDRGVVFQHSALFPWLTVRQNVEFGLTLRSNRNKNRGQAQEIIERVGLRAFKDHLPSQLSGGMRQRAAIASVLAIDPEILLMDEPFGALDSLTRSIMQDFLLELWEDNRKTVLFITHDIPEAIYLSDRVVVMSSHPGTVRQIFDIDLERPRDLECQGTKTFIELREAVTRMVREEVQTI